MPVALHRYRGAGVEYGPIGDPESIDRMRGIAGAVLLSVLLFWLPLMLIFAHLRS